MQQPKVSVIMPVYNSEKYLAECLNCVVNQTLREIEIICVDDGSTDNSLQILREFERHDPRVRVIAQRNQYAGVARNNGMLFASGEYLCFLDSDDYFEATMLEEMYAKAKADDLDVVICNANLYMNGRINSDAVVAIPEGIPDRVFSCYEPDFADHVFQCLLVVPWNKLFKRSFVQQHNFHFSSTLNYNDVSFVMASIVCAHKIAYMPRELVYWRYRNNSLIHIPKFSDSIYRAFHDLYDYISKAENYKLVEHSFINYVMAQSYHTFAFSQTEEQKILMMAFIKALNREFNILKYPDKYFYEQDLLIKFKKLVNWHGLPTIV